MLHKSLVLVIQVIFFKIDCPSFYSNLHELFCQFISWTNWVNAGKSCQVMADMKKVYDELIIINLYLQTFVQNHLHELFLCKEKSLWTYDESTTTKLANIYFLSIKLSWSEKARSLAKNQAYSNTITYKSSLTPQKMYKKTNAIFSMYGKNGIIPWHFFCYISFCIIYKCTVKYEI